LQAGARPEDHRRLRKPGNARLSHLQSVFKLSKLRGVSVSNPTPVVSATVCDANDGAEFDTFSRQKPEMKEDLHHFL
jgi:hypothetical protein